MPGLSLGLGLGLNPRKGVSAWILATGFWRDFGAWQDNAVWRD